MKKEYIKIIFLKSVLLIFTIFQLGAVSKFSSKTSQLRIAGNAQFNVSSPTVSIQKGGIKFDPTALVTGQPVAFDGVLTQGQDGAELEVKGNYDPAAGPFGTIYLTNNDFINATKKGAVRSNVVITGVDNKVRGGISFEGSIQLANPSAQVTLDLESPLNKTIETPGGGGRIDLARDTTFADNVDLIAGDIAFNGNRLSLGGKTDPFKKTTRFIKGADLVLNGKTELDGGTWIFIEESVLNANGNLIDLKNGGTFSLGTSTTLELTNAVLRNLVQDSLIFADSSSGLEISSSVLEVATTMTMTTGNVLVVGQSTIVIKDGSWTFTEQADLAVDGVSVLVDTSVNPNPNALVADAHFTNNGAIHYLFLDSIVYLFNSIHTSTLLTITSSFIVPQGEAITFGATTTVEAGGGSIIFTSPEQPQLILLPNSLVYFQNINLENISDKTFSIDPTATVVFGDNTRLVFSTDVTFSQGTILLDSPGKSVNMEGNLFSLMQFNPINNNNSGPLLDLGMTTLVLENILLTGPQFITYGTGFIDGELVTGAISLSGNMLVDIDSDLDMYFIVEKFNNYLRFRKTDIHLSGGISYKSIGENELIMAFLDSAVDTAYPRIFFADNYLYLSSELGRAHLLFDVFGAEVVNEGSNSFLFDIGGVLSGKNLVVNNFPIKLLSSLVDIDQNMNIFSDQPNAIEAAFIRSFAYEDLIDLPGKDVQSVTKELLFEGGSLPDEGQIRALQNSKSKKSIKPPVNPTILTNTVQLSDASGELILQSATIKKFGISATAPLNITLKDGAVLELHSNPSNPITLKNSDVINIVGVGNRIKVNSDFVIQGSLLFDDNSALIIEFENNAILLLKKDITLESGIEVSCQGDGRFMLDNGVKIILKESSNQYRPTEFSLENKAKLSVVPQATGYITGKGLISCYDSAGIVLDLPGTLAIGQNVTDSIEIFIANGQIDVGIVDALPTQFARLSLAYGHYRILNTLHGAISIGNNGVFEVNARNGMYTGGVLEKVSILSGSFFFIDTQGRLLLGENNIMKSKKAPESILISTESSFFRGNGIVNYLTPKNISLFEARLGSIDTSLYFKSTAISVQNWLYRLAQQSSKLKTALLFQHPNFTMALRFSNGVTIELGDDDEIVTERTNGNVVVYNHENDDTRTYRSNGTLIL